jgi:hypothetical protein
VGGGRSVDRSQKNFRPVHLKSLANLGKSSANFQKHQFSAAPFLPLFGKINQNSATNSFGQLFFSAAPFELFGRNFCHLATLGEGPLSS